MPTLKTIIHSRPDIKTRVYETYPVTKMERKGCEREKARLDYLRWTMAKRLMETPTTEKVEYK